MLSLYVIDVGDAENGTEPLSFYLHRTRLWCCARRRLRECCRHRGVKRDVSLHLLHRLVDVAVQYRHRSESPEISERLLGIVSAPSPLRINRPKRNVREHYDGCAGRQWFEIFLQPVQLIRTNDAQPAFADTHDVNESDEVNPFSVKAVPPRSGRFPSKSLAIQPAIV